MFAELLWRKVIGESFRALLEYHVNFKRGFLVEILMEMKMAWFLYLRLALIKVLVSILSTRLSTGLGFLGCVRGAWQGMYTKWYRIVI